jgi:hypothetical protein
MIEYLLLCRPVSIFPLMVTWGVSVGPGVDNT